MHVIVASVLSHLVVRTWLYLKINEKKYKRNINIDLAMVASQPSEKWFMTPVLVGWSVGPGLTGPQSVPD